MISANDRLRELVLAIGEDISNVGTETKERWAELVGLLALGPSPLRRACPFCKQQIMREASRCGSCWKPVPPYVEAEADVTNGSVTSF